MEFHMKNVRYTSKDDTSSSRSSSVKKKTMGENSDQLGSVDAALGSKSDKTNSKDGSVKKQGGDEENLLPPIKKVQVKTNSNSGKN